MPIWVSDFVLSSFGTGAVVGVPGHDLRDFEFAREFNIEIIRVVIGPDKDTNPITHPDQVQEESGTMTNSDFLNGLDINTATSRMMDHLEAKGWGKRVTNYRLRDWVFSRQRYWGEPIPLIHCDGCGWVPVPDKDLPVKLPKVEKYQPTDTGESPLSKVETWVNVKCPTCKGAAKRETDTMPNWAGSSWYFLRYLDPKNKKHFADKETMKDWLPVDWYNGGMEHATRHLLYARFWNQFLHDIGEVPASEPFKKRTAHGIILAADGKKMSKSLGNVVNPDELIKEFGADALRLYEMFIGPFSQMVAWDPRGILGTERFLQRVWRAGEQAIERDFATTDPKIERFLHKTIKKVGEDIESMGYNTAISAMMMFINDASAEDAQVSKADFEKFLSILAPFAPHITEELWSMLGNKESIHIAPWPEFNPQLLVDETFELVIQINGKVRATATAPSGISEADARQLALANPDAKKWVTGDIKKTIFVPNKLINLIV